ncbi:MAG: hypothetical protein ACKVS5_16380 [Parvularculaceae bacterium]
MRNLIVGLAVLGVAVVATLAFSRSNRDGPVERAAEDVVDALEDAGDDLEDVVDDANDGPIENAVDDVGDAIDDAGDEI